MSHMQFVKLRLAFPLPLLQLGFEDFSLVVWCGVGEFGEDAAGVEELGIEVLRGFVAAADDENFRRNISRRWWLRSFNLGEELVEYLEVVVRSA
jgi:hypothetical protein